MTDTTMIQHVDVVNDEASIKPPDVMLSTLDNPYNPYTNWEAWWSYDHNMTWLSCEVLGSLLVTSSDLPDQTEDREVYQTMLDLTQDVWPYCIVNKSTKTPVDAELFRAIHEQQNDV